MATLLAVNSAASLWGPYKDIWQTVGNVLWRRQPEAVHLLDMILKKHKPDFISLFRNPPKNVQQHEKVQKASTEGVAIQGQQGTRLLPEQLIKEAFILSDLFDIGELAAVELLLAGEHQQPHFPGLTRGLVAVLLYWDGKRCIANSLKALIQSRRGKTWTLELSPELVSMITRFTDELMEQGLTYKVLTLVSQIDVNNEFEKLQRERGLGSEKHRKEVSDLIKECRQSLAESIFSWACQSPLGKDDTLLLIGHLERVTVEANGSLDAVNLALLMALLYCFDISFIEQSTEERDDMIHQLPLLTERQYIASVHSRLQDSQPWKLPGLQATVRLAWALALRGISQLPDVTAVAEFTEADEAMAELAIADNVFLFLTESVVVSENFYQDEFYIRRIHNLTTDFLALMPMKVKQLRNRADEDARMIHMSMQMGNEPPISLRRDLEHLMLLIGELYRKNPFNLELALEYWCPSEPLQTTTILGSYLGVAHQRPPQRQVVLSKFVRQMGDLLPPTIYIPYLKMLQGLANGPQCAHYCFSLLKVNGSSHVENIQGTGGSPVSWEHFFHSLMLYHEHLRKDLPSADSVHYRHLPSRGITQKEQDGLIAFLQLTSTIITWSENARLALCEHPQWTPVVVILGLLQCSIPPVLKAELLRTLAAFGKSPEIAAFLWQSLEYTQILQTVRVPSQRQAVGIEVELNEIESRCEEYPLTRAFCQLISTLVESSFPSNLGAGLRPPGFDPYLQFLRDSVFLRFRTRAYRRAAEKWEVAEVVLEVFYKLLRDYEPQLEDFVDQFVEIQGEEIIAYKPPGFSLMYHLLNESPMLELALSLLEEGVKQLDTYAPFPGKKHLEKSVQHCLALLNLTLQKENLFMDLLRESQLALIVSPLEQLLQGINPRTKKADNVVNIARYLYHGNTNPELAFESAKILCCISCNTNIQIKLVGDFTQDQSVSQKLMAGFVECLDSEDTDEFMRLEEGSEFEKKLAGIRHETRIHILNLLITSLERNPPSLALYLLGFELKKPVSTTNLQDPGVLGCPRTCLHAILNILEKGTEGRTGPVAVRESPQLAELCYQVIYQLCACSDTSGPTMRYLRTSQDFLFSQLQHLPFSNKEYEISMLNQMSWLMKTACIELRVTSLNRQRSHTQRLLHLLLDDMPVKPYSDGEGGLEDENRSVSGFLHFDTTTKVRRKILSILDSIDFSQEIPEPLQLDFFDRVQIEQVIANCEHKNLRGQTVCNVKLLHRVLVAEVNALQGMAAIGQRPLLMEEISTILQYVVARNKLLQCLHAKRHVLESWRQLVEIILTACPQDLIQTEDRQLIIRDILQDVHDKILDDEAAQELMPVVAGAVFTLTAHLSQAVRTEQKQPLASGLGEAHYAFMLDSSFTSPPAQNPVVDFTSVGDSSLHIILKKLLDFILKTGGGFQRVRTHLYGSLLYYLQIAQRPDEPDTLEAAKKTMWERLTAPEDVFSKLQRENIAIIESYGAALMEVVCRDACDGHEIGRMLALALLDRIVSVDKQQQWLLYLSNSGYLKVLVDSLVEDDHTLQSLLTPQPPLLKALYTYESKMAFLTRVAKIQQGALELLRSGVIVRLAQCQVYDMRPEMDSQGMFGMRDPPVFIPTPVDRYRQILLPALRLCQVILTSSMAQHLQAAGQVLQFLISHSDTIQAILRCQDVSAGSLQELALLTGIISKAALPGILSELDVDVNEGSLMELQGHIGRFQRQCLGLLSRFGGSDRLRQFKFQDDNVEGDRVNKKDEIELAMQQICANVMEYCQSLMMQSSPTFQHAVCLFTPSLSETINRDGPRQDTQAPVVPYWRLPGLGIIVYLLKQSANDFFSYYDSHRRSVNKLQNVEQLPPDEIKELCQSVMPAGVDKISTAQKYVLARRRLVKLINNRAKLLSLCSFIIETCLFILWRHLEYYLLHCTPTDSQDSLFASRTLRRPRPAGWAASLPRASPPPPLRRRRQPNQTILGRKRTGKKKMKFLLFTFVGAHLLALNSGKAIFRNDTSQRTFQEIKEEIARYGDVAKAIIDLAVYGKAQNRSYERLALLVDTVGSRLSGSKGLEKAIQIMCQNLKEDGLENVHLEPVKIPHWERGEESAVMLEPRMQKMAILGLGSSIGTPPEGITAEVLVVTSFDELRRRAQEARGKIVVYNQPYTNYSSTVKYRVQGAVEAAKVGALASLIRSVASFSIYSPHTGIQEYQDGVPQIPTACITVEDAEMMSRMVSRGSKIVIQLKMGAKNYPDADSFNTVAEIIGSKYPEQVVLVSGHLDSWDVGQGAMDDGGGAFISWEALSLIQDLGLRPKRTLRLVLWTAEEQGGVGAFHYYQSHKANISNYSLVMESDAGTFLPSGLQFTGSEKARAIMKEVMSLLQPINVTQVFSAGEGTDINFWIQDGVPGASLLDDLYKYFSFHHSRGDTMTAMDPKQMNVAAAVWAVVSYVVADMEEMLPRS